MGTVHSRNLSARDKKNTPSRCANYVVKYKKSETEQLLDGTVAYELSERIYGSSAWMVGGFAATK